MINSIKLKWQDKEWGFLGDNKIFPILDVRNLRGGEKTQDDNRNKEDLDYSQYLIY